MIIENYKKPFVDVTGKQEISILVKRVIAQKPKLTAMPVA